MPKTNGIFSYPYGDKRRGFRIKANVVQYGYQMIATESQARTAKAFYPHRTAPDIFAIRIDLNGRKERYQFNRWMLAYMDYVLSPARKGGAAPEMSVRIPSRRFFRKGVPVEGIDFDYAVGKVLFSPTLVFIASREPLDAKYDEYTPSVVKLKEAIENSPHAEYFYPTGTQLSANQIPAANAYDKAPDVNDSDDDGKGGKDHDDKGTGGNQDIQDILDNLNPFD